jgi:hypothetical protein
LSVEAEREGRVVSRRAALAVTGRVVSPTGGSNHRISAAVVRTGTGASTGTGTGTGTRLTGVTGITAAAGSSPTGSRGGRG